MLHVKLLLRFLAELFSKRHITLEFTKRDAVTENSLLPMRKVKILPNMVIHFFVASMLLMAAVYGFSPSLHNFKLDYYLLAATTLLVVLSWRTSSLIIFLKGGQQTTQIGLWRLQKTEYYQGFTDEHV